MHGNLKAQLDSQQRTEQTNAANHRRIQGWQVRFPIGLVTVMAALLVVSTACSSTMPGKPAPTTPADGGQALPHDGAPKVPHLVDVVGFKAALCTVLTQSQLRTLGITAQPEPRPDDPAGPVCEWKSGINGVNIGINFIPNKGGLSDLYAAKKEGRFQVFEPIAPINGFPAALDLPTDSRSSDDCGYAVGFNDRDAVLIVLGERPGGNPCDDVKQVALSVTKAVQAGGSGDVDERRFGRSAGYQHRHPV